MLRKCDLDIKDHSNCKNAPHCVYLGCEGEQFNRSYRPQALIDDTPIHNYGLRYISIDYVTQQTTIVTEQFLPIGSRLLWSMKQGHKMKKGCRKEKSKTRYNMIETPHPRNRKPR